MMSISVCNLTKSLSDEVVVPVIRAINRQIAEDFAPHWHWEARLRLEGDTPNRTLKDMKQSPVDLRGDAILYLWDSVADVDGALGYHDQNNRGLPFGFVFTDLSEALGEHWSVTLSHEALELVGDANVNTLALGPHPNDPSRLVFHWYEMCDAVQAETYKVDGVEVSNFVLPLYFTPDEQVGGRNDFLTRPGANGRTLRSFGINPGGYVGFFDPETGKHETVAADEMAKKRLATKARARAKETRPQPRGATRMSARAAAKRR